MTDSSYTIPRSINLKALPELDHRYASCRYAAFCGKRMAHGDREHGCSQLDEQSCDPSMTVKNDTPTAPAGPDEKPYRKCSNCYRKVNKREWKLAGGKMSCTCGSWSWVEA